MDTELQVKRLRWKIWLPIAIVIVLAMGAVVSVLGVRREEAALLALGQTAVDEGKWSKAVSALTAAIETEPAFLRQSEAAARGLRGIAYVHQGDDSQALSDLSFAITANPYWPDLYAYRAMIYANQGNKELALADVDEALQAEAILPLFLQAQMLAVRAWALGQSEFGLAAAEQALSLEAFLPDERAQLLHAMQAQQAINQSDWSLAWSELQLALSQPDYFSNDTLKKLYAQQTAVLFALGDVENALAASQKSMELAGTLDAETAVAFHTAHLQLLLAQGQTDAALRSAAELKEVDANNPLPYAIEALAAYRQGRYEEALTKADAALEKEPQHGLAQRIRGTIHAWLGNFETALAALNIALEAEPDDVEALAMRAYVHYVFSDDAKAEDDVAHASAVAPDAPATLWSQAIQSLENSERFKAVALLNQAIAIDNQRPELYTWRAYAYPKTEQDKEAEADFAKAVALHADFIPALAGAIQLNALKLETERYQTEAERIIALNPDNYEGYQMLAFYHLDVARDVDKALEYAEQAVAKAPKLAPPYLSRGYAKIEKEAYAEAQADFEQVLQIEPTNTIALNGLASVFWTQEAYDEAESYFLQALEIAPDSLTNRTQLAALYLEMELYEAAWEQLHHVLSRDPLFPPALLGRAHLSGALGEPVKAIEDVTKYLAQIPNDGFAHFLRAQILLTMPDVDFNAVRESAEKALDLDATLYLAHTFLARADLANGDVRGAEAQLDLLTAVSLTEPFEYEELGWLNLELERYEEAVTAFTSALALDETIDTAHLGKAFANLALDEKEKAATDLEKVLTLSTNLTVLDDAEVRLAFLQDEPVVVGNRLRYEDTQLGFALDYADIWQRIPPGPDTTVDLLLLAEKPNGLAIVNVLVQRGVPATVTVQDIAALSTEDIKDLPGFEEISIEPTQLAGTTGLARQYRLTGTDSGGNQRAFNGWQYYVVKDGTMIILTLESDVALAAEFAEEFEAIVASLEILP